MEALPPNIESTSPDMLASLPIELQYSVLSSLRQSGGIQCLFPPRGVSRQWCRLIDDYLYHYFTRGPETLYCYVNLWNRFRQKLVQQRVHLRLRVRTMKYNVKSREPSPPIPAPQLKKSPILQSSPEQSEHENIVSWQPSSQSSGNPSLSPRTYTAYIYDACFDAKFNDEGDRIHPVDINPRTRRPISLGTGLTKLLERANQPPRSGTIFPLFHVIQEAWDFILDGDAALMPIYPPIASEAWLQIRLPTSAVAASYREPPAIHIEPTRDQFWAFRFDEYGRFLGDRDASSGQHQFAVISRLVLPNLVQDEGILLVLLRDTNVADWIQDPRYREIMQSMITVADVGGPQEFILGGAVVQLEDYERFIPRGMVGWFRRRILEKWTRSVTPENVYDRNVAPEEDALPPSNSSMTGTGSYEDGIMARLQHALEILGDEPFVPPRPATPPNVPPPRSPPRNL
jgi:hypothetical protein